MNYQSRVISILKASNLPYLIPGIEPFKLAELKIASMPSIELTGKLRLGHLTELIVFKLIEASANFQVRYKSVQLFEREKTIGELDFIIENLETNQLVHLELAYKFYLYDPSISSNELSNWIGPNRNDSLKSKLDKLKTKQFPLLYHEYLPSIIKDISIDQVEQALCFLVTFFIPFQYKAPMDSAFEKAVKGYYIDLDTFLSIHTKRKTYYLPSKKEYGIEPSENLNWKDLNFVIKSIESNIQKKQAVMCWQKERAFYTAFFIVWW